MKFFQRVLDWIRNRSGSEKRYSHQPAGQTGVDAGGPSEKFVCEHGATERNLKVTVLGVECEFPRSPMCPSCTGEYLNKFSTLCASCERPILPGTPVGQAWNGAPHPCTHLAFECCDSGGLYCGRWGEGRLITLHELNPDKYPEGTTTVLAHTFNTGGVVIIENMG